MRDVGDAPYPWSELVVVPRHAVREARRVRAALGPRPSAAALARAFGEILTSDVALVVRSLTPASTEEGPRPKNRGSLAHVVSLETEDGALRITISVEPALVLAALARLLGRDVSVTDPHGAIDPSLCGAFAALSVEAARRAGDGLLLRVGDGEARGGGGLELDLTVLLDERPYGALLHLSRGEDGPSRGARTLDLADLGELPLTLVLVAACSAGSRADVAALRVGDVWLPGEGWLGTGPAASFLGRVALASGASEHGVAASISEDGRIVVRGDVILLRADAEPSSSGGARSGTMGDTDRTLEDIVLDADVVVRVEVATLTLPAREWAELGPGDVIETGVRLAELVVLRVAGREVARGELVNVDGEVGVKIREILGARQGDR